MNQRTKNCDNVLRSEFCHYSQRNYHNMIALFLWAHYRSACDDNMLVLLFHMLLLI